MHQKKLLKSFLLIIIIFLAFGACQSKTKKTPPELRLFELFKIEERLVEDNSNDYVGYMDFQVRRFHKKNRFMSDTIKAINVKFEKMSKDEQREYQFKWQKQFQPVIDGIYAKTRQMILNQTKNLNDESMARIQELSIKMEILEKEVPSAKLKPQFFIIQAQ